MIHFPWKATADFLKPTATEGMQLKNQEGNSIPLGKSTPEAYKWGGGGQWANTMHWLSNEKELQNNVEVLTLNHGAEKKNSNCVNYFSSTQASATGSSKRKNYLCR